MGKWPAQCTDEIHTRTKRKFNLVEGMIIDKMCTTETTDCWNERLTKEPGETTKQTKQR